MEKNKCRHCEGQCVKSGMHSNGKQRFRCKECNKRQIIDYTYKAYGKNLNQQIVQLTKEGLGIRSTARVLEISPTTLLKKIMCIADSIVPPMVVQNQTYELDELRTYIGNKQRAVWLIYALDAKTRKAVCFKVGRRNKKNLKVVTDTLLFAKAEKIFTDKLPIYQNLLAPSIHSTKKRGTNNIERNHLTLRTHLKRLNRKTLCFSKSLLVFTAIIKIYFWL